MALCTHKTIRDHVVGETPEGRKLWRCSHCQTTGVWSETWSYFGNFECPTCWMAAIDSVSCSDSCREALAAIHGRAEVPDAIGGARTARDPAQPQPQRKSGAHAEARKRKALAALARLPPEHRAEVLNALRRKDEP